MYNFKLSANSCYPIITCFVLQLSNVHLGHTKHFFSGTMSFQWIEGNGIVKEKVICCIFLVCCRFVDENFQVGLKGVTWLTRFVAHYHEDFIIFAFSSCDMNNATGISSVILLWWNLNALCETAIKFLYGKCTWGGFLEAENTKSNFYYKDSLEQCSGSKTLPWTRHI